MAKDNGEDEATSDTTPLVPRTQRAEKSTDDDVDKDATKVDKDDDVIDSSFGWIIVFGGFLTQMVNVGLMRTDGIYYLQFRARFHESAQLSALPGATSLTIQSFVGPVATALCNRYSVRTTVILATILNVSGLALSGLCTDIYQLFFTYGILQGLGRGLTITPAIFLVNMYFNKMRARAIGVALTGSGLGTFVMIPLNSWFFDTFGFTKAYLMIAAIATSGFVAAALFRPLSMHREMKAKQKIKERALARQTKEMIAQNVLNEGIFGDEKTRNSLRQSEKEVEGLLRNKSQPTVTRPCTQDDCCNYLSNYEAHENNNDEEKVSWLTTVLRTCFPIEHKQKENSSGEKRKLIHFELLKDVPFLILCLSMVFFNIANKIFFSFLPALSISKGLTDSEAPLLISSCGVGDMFGRIAAGFIMDQSWVKRELFYGSVVFMCAFATSMLTVAREFGLFAIGAALYGCFGGVSISQKTTLLAGILGPDILTSSFGILYFTQGFGTLLGPPVSGAMKDKFGSYEYPFYFTSGCLTFSGILFTISCLLFAARRKRKEREKEKEENGDVSQSCSEDESQSYDKSLSSTDVASDNDDGTDDVEKGLLDRGRVNVNGNDNIGVDNETNKSSKYSPIPSR